MAGYECIAKHMKRWIPRISMVLFTRAGEGGGILISGLFEMKGIAWYMCHRPSPANDTGTCWQIMFTLQETYFLPGLPTSPDINLIEHIWDAVKSDVNAVDSAPTDNRASWKAVQWSWGQYGYQSPPVPCGVYAKPHDHFIRERREGIGLCGECSVYTPAAPRVILDQHVGRDASCYERGVALRGGRAAAQSKYLPCPRASAFSRYNAGRTSIGSSHVLFSNGGFVTPTLTWFHNSCNAMRWAATSYKCCFTTKRRSVGDGKLSEMVLLSSLRVEITFSDLAKQADADIRNARISRNALDADALRRNLLHPDWLPLIAKHRTIVEPPLEERDTIVHVNKLEWGVNRGRGNTLRVTGFPAGTRWSGTGMQRRGKRECPEEIRRQAASSSTIPTCENPGVNPPRIEPGSLWWETSAPAASITHNTNVKQPLISRTRAAHAISKLAATANAKQQERRLPAGNLLALGQSHACTRTVPEPCAANGYVDIKGTATPHHYRILSIRSFFALFDSNLSNITPWRYWHAHQVRHRHYTQGMKWRDSGGLNNDVLRTTRVKRDLYGTGPHQNARVGETGDPQENALTSYVIRHNFHVRKLGITPPGIEPASSWWEVSALAAVPTCLRYMQSYELACSVFSAQLRMKRGEMEERQDVTKEKGQPRGNPADKRRRPRHLQRAKYVVGRLHQRGPELMKPRRSGEKQQLAGRGPGLACEGLGGGGTAPYEPRPDSPVNLTPLAIPSLTRSYVTRHLIPTASYYSLVVAVTPVVRRGNTDTEITK
ncbi:hypothetical protein PR048_017025 [Dryococelus australis]|uniref:Uncharacterized protein n=1 Tax=Dryococelus australis TaxID=614101 RepID=A0ABQ9H8K3_9NEOP|nr:hypothetical protein PR048_017025 [Dryococelus australis]